MEQKQPEQQQLQATRTINIGQMLFTFVVTLLLSSLLIRLGWNLIVIERSPELIMTYRQALGISLLIGMVGNFFGQRLG